MPSNAFIGGDDYLGFDPHVSSQSPGDSTFTGVEDDKDRIQMSADDFNSSDFHEDYFPHSSEGCSSLSDRYPRFSSAASPFSMSDSNESVCGEEVNGGVFISDGPIPPFHCEMQPDDGFFLREWHRSSLRIVLAG